MKPIQIAIDGPVASGKSSVASRLAQRLGCPFLDTGALYRAVAWLALERGVAPDDEAAVTALLDRETPAIATDGTAREAAIRVGTRELGDELFAPAIARAVSPIAAMPRVRERLVPAQRAFADDRVVVMAGRDIGTVILPDAAAKFFLTASLDARVDRRLRELLANGVRLERDVLAAQIERRDARDSLREASPLVKAPDAIEIDTTDLTLDQVVDALERRVREIEAQRA
jgi:cytidylate kinase